MIEQKSKLKKYFGLLRTAQNTAFVGLVCDNLRVELQQKPWKTMKVLDFILKEVPRVNSDFTRLKLAEGIIPLLNEGEGFEIIQKILDQAQGSQKIKAKLKESLLVLDLAAESDSRTYFTLSDMIKYRQPKSDAGSKTFFQDLLELYQPLLAELNLNETTTAGSSQAGSSKDSIKQMFMEGTLGSRVKTDKLKLSDFIDESFFEDVDIAEPSQSNFKSINQIKGKLEVRDLLKKLRASLPDNRVIMSESAKRLKTEGGLEKRATHAVMSPLLAICMHILTNDCLVDSDWKVRQAASSTFKLVLKESAKMKQLAYVTVNSDLEITGTQKFVDIIDIVQALTPQIFLTIIKDNFNDFEELKVLTPVREEASGLLQAIIEMQLIPDEIAFLIGNLPALLKSIDLTADESWITKYNFFILIKTIFQTDERGHEGLSKMKHGVFQMFSRVLIESLLNSEDEVRIIVTEVINLVLPMMLEQDGFEKQITYLLKNLLKNLKQSDEIESSAISVFALITRIIDSVKDLAKLSVKFDVATFCPYNFHKIVNVRYSYLQILNKCLSSGTQFALDDLQILIKLTLQSLAMERSKPIVKMNLANLKLLISRFSDSPLELLQIIDNFFLYDQSLPNMIYSFQFQNFDTFQFFESKNFESIERDYFKVVFRPVSPEELSQFYFGKMKNLSQALAKMMEHSPQVASQIMMHMDAYMLPPQTMDQNISPPVHEAHMIFLLALCNVLIDDRQEVLNLEQLSQVSNFYMYPQTFSENQISIHHFKDLPRLQNLLSILYENLQKDQMKYGGLIQALQPLYDMMNACFYEHKLVNLVLISQLIETTLTPLFDPFVASAIEIYDCFSELRQVFSSMVEYANVTCTRIKQFATFIHVLLAEKGGPQGVLTTQLNQLIKPVLNQVKKESVIFIQNLACKQCLRLMELLFKTGKVKPAQQMLALLMKDVEQIKQGPEESWSSGDRVQDRGILQVFKYLAQTGQNVFQAFQKYTLNYLNTQQDPLNLSRILLFSLKIIDSHQRSQAKDLYDQEQGILAQLACRLFESPGHDLAEVPEIFLLIFKLFKQEQPKIVSSVVQAMKCKNRLGFETLKRLLYDLQEQQQTGSKVNTQDHLLQYITVFIIPVIQSIQYSRDIYRDDKQVTLILAQLLSLLPLNLASLSAQQGQITQLEETKQDQDNLHLAQQEGLDFLQLFINSGGSNQAKSQKMYKLSIPVKAHLRDYQLQGITWLASLGHYNLNCALCDDMGLGKTLQSLCVVLNESYLRKKQGKKGGQAVVNLIVCPTTITYNWNGEVKKYFDGVKVAVYEGTQGEKAEIIKNINTYDVIIISYDKLRNDAKQLQSTTFFYVILDEAHIIKNAKAKVTQAVKGLKCEKKIILTGTPLQNRVSELWSIFDFLMPGFLEEESVFNKKYNQYLTSNIKKLSEKLEETQNFVNALKSLKKRISPFILRRTKDEVLKELPPKIIQDVVCKMTAFQEHVHSVVEKNHPITQTIQQSQQQTQPGGPSKTAGKQILQNLILHRKVCNHPMFVARDFQEKDKSIKGHIGKRSEKELMGYEQSGKLMGLYDKLVECEIIEKGVTEEVKTESHQVEGSFFFDLASTSIDVNQVSRASRHRALIFCQMGTFLRLIVDEVLVKFGVPYLELLSSHSPKERHDIVNQFNSNDHIRVLILTTAVGGLGLTLTGADTVIFAEHDWNPMKDLQAIDRAHRIGQTRQVCVYRLIMQDTLEEKIMNLQRFKENLARSLVQSRDASIDKASNMELTDLISSFQEHSAFNEPTKQKKHPGLEDKLVSNIEEIWQGGAFSVEDL